ncbi:PAS domain-containing sensor histidine kinase [Candidatus Liberibacter brunswickensis]|uniref:PAS domain-containing sensor histidine kinase n=1 Tax=Candidatus Liberibacter brunswickensis TaxID=1968796 RepID=UPI002FE2668A
MENVQNISQSCGLCYSRNRQKITVSFKNIFKRLHISIIQCLFPTFLSFSKTIPIVSIAFLVIIAISSIIKVTTKYAQQEQITDQKSIIIAKAIEAIFKNNKISFNLEFQKKAESILGEIIIKRFFPESLIILTKSDGTVFASSDNNSHYIGEKISNIIPKFDNLKDNDKIFKSSEVFISQKPYHVSSIHLSDNDGLIFIINSNIPLLRFWREEVTLEIVFFAGISSLLLLMLFNYYRQEKNNILFQSSLCFETALSHGRCGIWNFNLDKKKFYLSHSMHEIFGIPCKNQAISFREIARLIHCDDKTIYQIARSIIRKRITQLDQIFQMRNSIGDNIWIKVRAQMMRTSSGSMNVIGVAMDVTEQYYLEKRYAEADKQLSKAIERTSEAFVLCDKDDLLVMCNVHYQKAYGLPDNVLIPRNTRSNIKNAQIHPVVEHYTSDPTNSQNISKEIKLANSRWIQINEWRTNDGGTISVGTDITQLKRNQKKLRESKRQLKATINDLYTSRQILERHKTELLIANSKYQFEKERVEIANKAKSEFLSKMSHELRTPLNAILGFSEIIKREIFGELGSIKYYEYAKDIHDSGQHLLNIINDILEMSKIETDQIHINKQKINLIPIIDESLQLVYSSAYDKNITIEKKISSDLFLNADQKIIKKILFPILSNSIKFTNNGGKMMIRTSTVNKSVIITIADTGIGIPKSDLARIGRPFEQLHNQYYQSIGGSGLGLSISDALTNLHGGRLKIISKEGKGTIVSICMPQ